MDPNNHELEHFLAAQDSVWRDVLDELQRGDKRSHWMWFVFPQLRGLGMSAMSQRYAIADAEQAGRYLAHPILGARLRQCTELILGHRDKTAEDIFGSVDAKKLRSSLTLFLLVAESGSPFHRALEQFFESHPDGRTLSLLGR